MRRFDPDLTWGEGPKRLKNLYFLYLVELRALAKAAPYLAQVKFHSNITNLDYLFRLASHLVISASHLQEQYYTGHDAEDKEVRMIMKELLEEITWVSTVIPFEFLTLDHLHNGLWMYVLLFPEISQSILMKPSSSRETLESSRFVMIWSSYSFKCSVDHIVMY